jgi:hypothetical protein
VIAWTRPRILTAAAAGLAVVAIYFASPFYMLWQLQRAAERNDTATLERLIDFPTVRATMKAEAASSLRDQIGSVVNNKLVAGLLGGPIGPEVTNRAIDERVTPAAAAQMIKGAKVEHASFGGLTRFNFEARGLKASACFTGFGWRVVWVGLPGQ